MDDIVPGDTWISQRGSRRIVRHVYFDDTISESVIVFQFPDNTWGAFPNHAFRLLYRKIKND